MEFSRFCSHQGCVISKKEFPDESCLVNDDVIYDSALPEATFLVIYTHKMAFLMNT